MRHLYRFRGFYYFRARIPFDLQGVFQYQIIKKGLKTKDFKTATVSVKLISNEFYRVLKVIRSGILTDEQIKQLVKEFFQNTLQRSEELKAVGKFPDDKGFRENLIAFLDSYIERLKGYLFDNAERIEGFVDSFLEGKAIPFNKESVEYKKLRKEFIKALIEYFNLEKERTEGNYNNWYDDFRSTLKQKQIPQQIPVHAEKKKGKLFSEVAEEYIKEKTTKGDWKSKFTDENVRLVKQFVEIMGDRYISEFDRPDLMGYMEILTKLPKNLNKVKGLREKPLKDILSLIQKGELNDYPLLDTTSINKKIGNISPIFNYAERQGYIKINCAKDLKLKDDTRPDEERDPYELDDLKRWFFHSPVYTAYTPEKLLAKPERFWIPLIMLFTGCRTNETCQLYKKDIIDAGGIWCFSINSKGDKSTKTIGSRRTVPVHPILIELGFIKFVNSVNHERLWANLKQGRDGYAHHFVKWIDRYNRKYITKEHKKVPYSFRHSLSTNLKHKGIPQELVDEITGHVVKGESFGRYGKKFTPNIMLDALMKLDYGIDLSNLRFPIAKKEG
jgi:integrase